MGRALLRCILAVCIITFVAAGALITDYYLKANKSADDFNELAHFMEAVSEERRIGAHVVISNGSTEEVAPGMEGQDFAYNQDPSRDHTPVDDEDYPSDDESLPTSADAHNVEKQTETSSILGSGGQSIPSDEEQSVYPETDQSVQTQAETSSILGSGGQSIPSGEEQSVYPETDQSIQKQTEVSLDPRIIALRALAERNTDMVGWVRIDDTPINYPVMQSKEDAEYYLHRDFEKQPSDYGTPFIGSFCDVDKPSDNILIYGHHMKNGSMFAGLMNYENQDFFERHQIIRFDTLNELGSYQIIAVFKSQVYPQGSNAFEYYMFTDAEYPDVFDEYVANVKERSLYDTGHTAGYGDKLITLSTCEYTRNNGRMVVVARRIAP